MHGLGFYCSTSGSRLGLCQQHAGGHDVLQPLRGGRHGSMMQKRTRCSSSHAYAASAVAQHRSPREQQHQASLQARLRICVLISSFYTLQAGVRMLTLHRRWLASVGVVQRGCSSCPEPCRVPNSGGWMKMAASLCQASQLVSASLHVYLWRGTQSTIGVNARHWSQAPFPQQTQGTHCRQQQQLWIGHCSSRGSSLPCQLRRCKGVLPGCPSS